MPSLTPEELQEAKRRKAEERLRQEEQERIAEEEEIARWREREERDRLHIERERALFDRHVQLDNYVAGIYEEVSKFSTKWPSHHVTPMMVDRANRAIKSARELLADEPDEYLEEIIELVPAGDAVQAQDVTLTPRTVKDALARMKSRHDRSWRTFQLP